MSRIPPLAMWGPQRSMLWLLLYEQVSRLAFQVWVSSRESSGTLVDTRFRASLSQYEDLLQPITAARLSGPNRLGSKRPLLGLRAFASSRLRVLGDTGKIYNFKVQYIKSYASKSHFRWLQLLTAPTSVRITNVIMLTRCRPRTPT